jgi:hypothetical protein
MKLIKKIIKSFLFRYKNSRFYFTTKSYLRKQRQRSCSNFKKDSLAIMTVFILKENILFLEEWIQHHLNMGVDYFVLYDNSKVQVQPKLTEGDKFVRPGKINKHNVNYSEFITDEKAKELYVELLDKYHDKIDVIPWDKKNDEGEIEYFQLEAYKDFISNYFTKFEYGLFIDMDEFMISRSGMNLKDIIISMKENSITSLYFNSKLFSTRFNHVGNPTSSINKCLPYDRNKDGQKSLVKWSVVKKITNPHIIDTIVKFLTCDNDTMIFYHYCYSYNGPGTKLIKDNNAIKHFGL